MPRRHLFTEPKTVFKLAVIGLGESSMTDSYQRRWMQWASSEPGPLGLPALLKTLPCALSWNTEKQASTYYTQERFCLTQYILRNVELNCTTDGIHTHNLILW